MNNRMKPRIVRDENIRFGKPTIEGTRIAATHVLRLAAQGWSTKEILDELPHLTEDAIAAVMDFAADVLDEEWKKTRPEGHGDWLTDGPEWQVVGEERG